ncbi:MAG: hypothetical protein HS115_14175 [Spirochaetales bacterium]|nr:hypothetical protein [Spirochaetales bacterium]
MIVYLDSSALLRYLLKTPGAYADFGTWDKAVSSELLTLECRRTLHRLRLIGELGDEDMAYFSALVSEFMDTIDIIRVTSSLMDQAGMAFPTVIGSLDAIHLVSLLAYQGDIKRPVALLSHGRQLVLAARSLGVQSITLQSRD